MTTTVKLGSKWSGGSGNEFWVIALVEDKENTWVHYRDSQAREYSCYLASFLQRFTEQVNS